MLIVGVLLFFTVLEMQTNGQPTIKIGSITGSTVAISNQPVYEENTDFINIKSCKN